MQRIEVSKMLYFLLRIFSKKIDFLNMGNAELKDYELYLSSSYFCEVKISDFEEIRILKKEKRYAFGVGDYIHLFIMLKYDRKYYLLQADTVDF